MRVSFCKCHCPLLCSSKWPLRCYLPCFRKSADEKHVSPSLNPITAAVEEKSSDERIDVANDRVNDGKEEVHLKSSLKKTASSESNIAEKGNVKWMDFLGKEIAEIQEFEPRVEAVFVKLCFGDIRRNISVYQFVSSSGVVTIPLTSLSHCITV